MSFRTSRTAVPAVALFLSIAAQAQPTVTKIVNAADYSEAVSPGALVSIFGTQLAADTAQAPVLPLPTTLVGSSVEITAAGATSMIPLWFVAPGQINAQLPYGLAIGAVQIRVRTGAGLGAATSVNILATSPALFTITQDGLGRPFVTKPDYSLITSETPLKPGDVRLLFLGGLGATNPAIAAGAAPGDGDAGGPLNRAVAQTSVAFLNASLPVEYAGLAPGFPGLYQVNFRSPYYRFAGDVPFGIISGARQSQDGVFVPVEPNGFYWAIPASLFPNGQTANGRTGSNNSLAFIHQVPELFGDRGFNSWTKDTGFTEAQWATWSGVAVTLRNGNNIVYDNNGLETAAATGGVATFYDNRATALADGEYPGTNVFFSNSQNSNAAWAGHMRLTQSTTVTQIIAYFDGNGQSQLPFDPNNPYVRYRMNIYSNTPANLPGANSFAGNIFSTDNVQGSYAISPTAVSRRFKSSATLDPIWRVSFTLAQPLTISAGDYWFSSDGAIQRDAPIVELSAEQKARSSVSERNQRPAGSVWIPTPARNVSTEQ